MAESDKTRQQRGCHPGKAFRSLDLFGESVGFLIEGKATHQSILGAFVSLVAIVVTLSYFLDRTQTMLEFGDTVHQTTEEVIEYTKEQPLNYDESGMAIAVGFIDNHTAFPSGINPADGYLDISFGLQEWD